MAAGFDPSARGEFLLDGRHITGDARASAEFGSAARAGAGDEAGVAGRDERHAADVDGGEPDAS